MGYRDEGEAALQRVQNLETRVAEAEAENRDLEVQLARANAEIVRLRGKPIEATNIAPLSTTARAVFGIWLGVAVVALGLFASAAYRSETKGMHASLFVFPLWTALFGAWRSRHQSAPRIFIVSLVWGFATFFGLIFFFATLWRGL
jgi:hypothetical protein